MMMPMAPVFVVFTNEGDTVGEDATVETGHGDQQLVFQTLVQTGSFHGVIIGPRLPGIKSKKEVGKKGVRAQKKGSEPN